MRALKLYKSDYEGQKKAFEKEKTRLLKLLNPNARIEHIGSTSVPGLDGKGIIDMIIVAQTRAEMEKFAEILVRNGYFYDFDTIYPPDRTFLASREHDSTRGDYHVHILVAGTREELDALKFRDMLRADEKLRDEYEKLKYELHDATNANRRDYKRLKSEFIVRVLGR
ncbi:GrpB family protein [Candidatus Saccharibacteria bacterium]|nr:GrpB family protein [Candidatus Saccharibacteria bacterium]MCL1963335.1 GrpB family protein [Candidatus Saccharibacteria bacterium]